MSRIGKKPVDIPSGVTVSADGPKISAKGPKGDLSLTVPGRLMARVEGGKVVIGRSDDSRESMSLHGLTRSLIANLLEGVSKGYKKELEIQGVGFKAAIQGQELTLLLGFSAPVKYTIPDGIKIAVEGGVQIVVNGADKQKVGDVTARIRSFFPAEAYKGKGIRYRGEYVRRKVGKTVA